MNLAITAGCGYGGLVLLTHMYSVQAVGLSATAVSAGSLVCGFTQFGTDYSLARYLPTSRNRQDLINTLHTLIILSTPVVAVIFLLLPAAHSLYALGGWLFAPIFIVVSTLQASITFLGLVYISDRASGTLAKIDSIPNAVRLVAPLAFTAWGGLGAFLARTVSNLFSFIVNVATLARRGHRFRLIFRFSAMRELARFSLGMYVFSTVGGLPPLVLPIIVLSRLGAKGAAYWSVAYVLAMSLYLLPSVIIQAVLPEIASRPTERRALLWRAVLLISAVVFPTLAIAYICAPMLLIFFGRQYVSTALTPLRWLIATGFMVAINYIPGAILFLAKKTVPVVVIGVLNLVIVLGLAALWATDPEQMAIAWFVGGVGNTILFALFACLSLRDVGYRLAGLGADLDSEVSSVTAPTAAAPAADDADAPMPASLRQPFEVLADIAERQRIAREAGETVALTSTGVLYRALDVLAGIAEQQQGLAIHYPRQYHRMTEPQGVYSVLMFQEAERVRVGSGSQDRAGDHGERSERDPRMRNSQPPA